MELTRKQIIALIISTSEKGSPFKLTYDTPTYQEWVRKGDEDNCWDVQYFYYKLEYRLFGGSLERGFQMVTFLNKTEAEVVDVMAGFQRLENEIHDVVSNQAAPNLPTLEKVKTKCVAPGSPEDEHIDCEDCQGTGIGYNHEPRSCGRCKGRGYNINSHYLCPDCPPNLPTPEKVKTKCVAPGGIWWELMGKEIDGSKGKYHVWYAEVTQMGEILLITGDYDTAELVEEAVQVPYPEAKRVDDSFDTGE